MIHKGKYRVSDLVSETGVPRTTINDWLQRFSQYLGFEMQGKRKLYSQHALEVIREIIRLRDSGCNIIEIEEKLAAEYPIKPEIAEPGEPNPEETESPMPEQNCGDNGYSLIARRQTEELARLLGEQLNNLHHRLSELENSSRADSRKHSRILAASIILCLALACAAAALFAQYRKELSDKTGLMNDNIRTATQLENSVRTLSERERHINDLSTTLLQSRNEYSSRVEQLKQQLNDEKSRLAAELESRRREQAQAHARELETLRESFAAERLQLMRKLDDIGSDSQEKVVIISKLQQQSLELTAALRRLAERQAEQQAAATNSQEQSIPNQSVPAATPTEKPLTENKPNATSL